MCEQYYYVSQESQRSARGNPKWKEERVSMYAVEWLSFSNVLFPSVEVVSFNQKVFSFLWLCCGNLRIRKVCYH